MGCLSNKAEIVCLPFTVFGSVMPEGFRFVAKNGKTKMLAVGEKTSGYFFLFFRGGLFPVILRIFSSRRHCKKLTPYGGLLWGINLGLTLPDI